MNSKQAKVRDVALLTFAALAIGGSIVYALEYNRTKRAQTLKVGDAYSIPITFAGKTFTVEGTIDKVEENCNCGDELSMKDRLALRFPPFPKMPQ